MIKRYQSILAVIGLIIAMSIVAQQPAAVDAALATQHQEPTT